MEHPTASSPFARTLLAVHLAGGPLVGMLGTGAIATALATGKSVPLAVFVALAAPGMALGAVPSSTAILACGALHGWAGAAALYPALVAASLPGFVALRRWFRPEARALLSRHPVAESVVARLERNAFPIATLLRVAPVSTFSWTNALLSASSLRAGAYAASTALGLLPRLALLTWAGASGRDLASALRGGTAGLAPAVALAVSIGSLAALGWIASRVLRDPSAPPP